MRPSIVLPSALLAVAIIAAGTIWADAASHRTVSGRPSFLGATGTVSSAAPASTQAPSPTSDHTPASPTSPKPTARRSTAGAAGAKHAAVPYRAPTQPQITRHGSCASAHASGTSSAEAAVFAMLNRQRADNGLCPMQWSSLLQTSARQHSTTMDQKSTAADCSDGNYSHRYAGEPDIDTRIFATGYPHGPIAEAIGCSPDTSTQGALTLQQLMYDEKPPANQHREMILSSIVNHVGIAIVVDSRDGTLWLTEDYGS